MTRKELIEKMAKDAGISKVAAMTALDSFFMAVRISLKNDRIFKLRGFGTFRVDGEKECVDFKPGDILLKYYK